MHDRPLVGKGLICTISPPEIPITRVLIVVVVDSRHTDGGVWQFQGR